MARRGVPAHQQLSDDLRKALRAGEFVDGSRLPTEAELERQYAVSRQTVRRAFQDLVAEGLVERTPGRGTYPVAGANSQRYVRPVGSIEELMEWDDSDMEVLQSFSLESRPEVARRLELRSNVVAVLLLRRTFNGRPFGVTRVHVSPDIGTRLVEDAVLEAGPRTIIGAVQRYLPDPVARVQQVINAVAADARLAQLLELQVGSPALEVERTYFDAQDRPVELAMTHYNPDRYAYRLELRGRMSSAEFDEQDK
jgi:DNA-binding GntR family transcriptional regulator